MPVIRRCVGAEVYEHSSRKLTLDNVRARQSRNNEELLRTIARSAGFRPVLMRILFAFWDVVAGLAPDD
jgi:hypothetical protein